MSAKFYTLLTDIGAAKLASTAALGVSPKITRMAVGDGGAGGLSPAQGEKIFFDTSRFVPKLQKNGHAIPHLIT